MKMQYLKTICLAVGFLSLCATTLTAQDPYPTINPLATFTKSDGTTETGTEYSGSAPLEALFEANAEWTEGWTTYYEWRFTLEGELEPYLVRYEEDTQVTFTRAGSHRVQLYAIFTQGNDSICYTDEYWADADPLRVTISESKLEMPNAFSPNGDEINDVYRAKEGYQSLVEFHAVIYNRWGQKLYEWNDPAGSWDGTFHGTPVKQGVYFVHVTAKGADGRKYNIRRDVNLLRGFTEREDSTPTE